MTALAPLTDITNLRRVQSNIQAGCNQPSPLMSRSSMESTVSAQGLSPEASFASPLSPHQQQASSSAFDFTPAPHTPMFTVPQARPSVYRHDPYNWKCLPQSDQQATMLLAQRASHFAATQRTRKGAHGHVGAPQRPTETLPADLAATSAMTSAMAHASAAATMATALPTTPLANCRILVQFKCHHGEFASMVTVEKGQYVVVQGDRGMDIGVVIRVNTEAQKTYIERTGPCGSVMRHATQREVDYWASELKADEQAALEFCQRRVAANDLVMEVRHAEYQFDKKKLTFYYDAKSRVDFVTLLKDLYREFGCRIWMEKVRTAEISPNA